jgi:hypothetical protein
MQVVRDITQENELSAEMPSGESRKPGFPPLRSVA